MLRDPGEKKSFARASAPWHSILGRDNLSTLYDRGQCPNLGHHGRFLPTERGVTPDSDPGSSPAFLGMDSLNSPE